MRNKRQWKYRLKNNLCWDCNKPLEELVTHDAKKCSQCGFVYSEVLLNVYKAIARLKNNQKKLI